VTDPLDAYLASRSAPAPDPLDSYLAAREPPKPPPGKVESFLRGARSGVTFGFGDELAGALESVLTGKEYGKARDEARALDKAAKEANPGTYLAGEIGGGVASAVVPGGAIVKGAGVAANIARGAGAGILAGIGSSEADLTKGDVEGIVKDAATSGLVGGVVGGVVGTAAQKLLHGAQGRVDKTLMSDIGDRATPTLRKKLADIAPAVRETARSTGLAEVAREPAELASQATTVRKAIGQRIGETYKALDKHYTGANIDDVTTAIRSVKARYDTPADATVRKQIDAEIENITEMWGKKGRVGLEQLNRYIGKLESKGFAGADLTPAAGAQLKRDLAGQLEGVLQKRFAEIQEHAANVATSPSIAQRPVFAEAQEAAEGLRALEQLNQQYRALKLIEKAGKERSRLDPFKPTGLRSFTVRGLAEKAYEGTLGRLQRPADERIAKLVLAAKNGDPVARAAVAALGRGLPQATSANAEDIPGGALSAVAAPLLPSAEPY
jgi:hypothetical protein